MRSFKGQVEGRVIAIYKKWNFTWTCKISQYGYYCATFHNGRQSAITYSSKNKDEINDLIRRELQNGFKMILKVK